MTSLCNRVIVKRYTVYVIYNDVGLFLDPYVILTVRHDGRIVDEKITCTKWNQRNPQFDANFVLEISRERIGTTSLLLRVMNNSANHCLIGAAKIGMDSLEDSGREHWNMILEQDGVHDERWHKLFK